VSYQDPAAGGRQPTEEELRAAMEEQMRRIRVQDVLLQTAATLVNLGGRRLGLAPDAGDERDLEQARLAIEGVRALTPLLGADEASAVRDALSQLQVAYARESQQPAREGGEPASGEGPAPDQGPAPGQSAPQPGSAPSDEAARAKARSKIWTPGRD
jgi:hypothetical protein